MSETPARDGMLDFALAAFKDSPNPVVSAHANKLADAFEAEVRAAVPSAPAARSAILREAVERLRQVPFTNVLTDLRRMANEAEYVATPCSFGACEPGGEPCTTHERLMAHAEGDHELCGPDCGTSPSRVAVEAQQPASTAPLAANLPLVQGRCPACNGASLFLGDGGYVTCSRIDCPEPDAASTALEQPVDEAQRPEAERCGAWGGCPLARGHNIGQADIPENHRPSAVGAQQPETRQSCACGQDGCEYCDVDDEPQDDGDVFELPGPEVVAYRNADRPSVLLCREHGDGWWGLTPLTSDDLPDGGTCTYGDPADPGDVCGRDVLIGGARQADTAGEQQ